VQAPSGWEDRTDTAELKAGADYQAVYEAPPAPGDGDVAPTLLIDDAEPPRGTAARLAGAVAMARDGLREAEPGVRLAPVQELELAGEPARAFEATGDGRRRRTVVAVHGGRVYTISLTTAAGAFDQRAKVMDAVLGSWRWED
jgi:hypothetical protein